MWGGGGECDVCMCVHVYVCGARLLCCCAAGSGVPPVGLHEAAAADDATCVQSGTADLGHQQRSNVLMSSQPASHAPVLQCSSALSCSCSKAQAPTQWVGMPGRHPADHAPVPCRRMCYIPFVRDICPGVDLKQGRLEVTPPEGLLDVVSVVSTRRARARGLGKSTAALRGGSKA